MGILTKSLILFFSFNLLISCNQLEIVPNKTDPILEDRIANDKPIINLGEDKKSLSELILGERSVSLDYAGSITFQTALDKVSFMPLSSVDAASGVIITDWYNIDGNELRVKINIRIFDQSMTDESISVQMFKQNFDGSKWNDLGNDEQQSSKIKGSILEEARVLQATIDLS
tara:strand:- start:115 stop:630 length:516 start_codon:yes stop_codon:yes gene_type:complete